MDGSRVIGTERPGPGRGGASTAGGDRSRFCRGTGLGSSESEEGAGERDAGREGSGGAEAVSGGQAARPRVARPRVDARRVEGHCASLGPRGLGRNVLLEVTPISGRPGKQRGLLIPDRNDTNGAEGVAWAHGNEKSTLG